MISEKECAHARRCQQPDDNTFELVGPYGQNTAALRRFQLVSAELALARLSFAGFQAEQGVNLKICQRLGYAFSPGGITANPACRCRRHSHATSLMLQVIA